MNLIVYGRGFPNPVEPNRSAFLLDIIDELPLFINVIVVAPVPYFLEFRKNSRKTHVPLLRTEHLKNRSVDIYHPRFFLMPRNLLKRIIGKLEYIACVSVFRLIITQWRIDLMHVNWSFPDGVAARLLHRKFHIPYVVTEHQGSILNLLKSKFAYRQIHSVYKDSLQVMFVSASLKRRVETAGFELDNTCVINNGIDMSRYVLTHKKSQPGKFVYLGNLIYDKGIHILIQAFLKISKLNTHASLTIIGDGKYKSRLIDLVLSLHLKDIVHFKNPVSHDTINSTLLLYDVLILPSFAESFGMVLLEAMATGLPVISTYCGGPEQIVSEETGVLVVPDSVPDMESGIANLIDNWNSYEPEKIRNSCFERFNIRKTTNDLVRVYQETLENLK